MGRVGDDHPCIRRNVMAQLNGGGQRGAQKPQGFLDHRLQVDEKFLLLALAAEGENLADELLGALGGG